MTDRYIDPNSGAAPQPGGYSLGGSPEDVDPNEEHPAGNVTEPDEARELSEEEANEPTAGVEDLPDELVRAEAYDTEIQNQAAPQGPQPGAEDADPIGPVGSYVGDPSLETDDEGNPRLPGESDAANNDEGPTATDADGQQTDVAEETGTEEQETITEEGTTEAPAEQVEKPGGNASRADWVKFAKSEAGGKKADAELEGKTRDEIRDLYA